MAFGESCVKFFVAGANFTFALGGLSLLLTGLVYKLNIDAIGDAIPKEDQNIRLVPTLTIIVGAIVFVIAFFGCCGAIRESPCMLTTYAVILLTIFLLQIAVGIYAFLEIKDQDVFKAKVKNTLTSLFNEYGTKNASQELVDLIQQELECCGTTGPTYWDTSKPNTCYEDSKPTNKLFTNGCIDEFFEYLTHSIKVIGIVILSLSTLEVIGSIFSLCLSSSIRNRERRFRY